MRLERPKNIPASSMAYIIPRSYASALRCPRTPDSRPRGKHCLCGSGLRQIQAIRCSSSRQPWITTPGAKFNVGVFTH